jgi:hypothetical protein
MKKHPISVVVILSLLIVFSVGYLFSADKPRINMQAVSSAKQLIHLFTGMDNEIDALRTLANELRADHATTRTLDGDQTTLVNGVRTWTQAFPLGNPGFAISSNFDITNGNAFSYCIAGTLYSQAGSQSFDTGSAATFPAATWGIALLSLNAAGTETVTWATNSGAGYASEALAIAALPATPADHCPLGYATVLAHASNSFTAGTDALQGGTGGHPSADTNYYNKIDAQGSITAAVSSSPPATLTAPAVTEQVVKGK